MLNLSTAYTIDLKLSGGFNPFVPNVPFLYPLYPMFSGGRERVY